MYEYGFRRVYRESCEWQYNFDKCESQENYVRLGDTKAKAYGLAAVCLIGPHRSMYPSDPTTEEERKRMSGEQIGLTCLDRDREAYIR